MIVSLLVAMDELGGIGKGGGLPWRLPADLRRFKALTMGHHLIMGRKTYESIGRPLPGRTTLIITRNLDYAQQAGLPAEVFAVSSLNDALNLAQARGETEAFVIGGGEIFALALPLAQRIYLTRVHTNSHADVFFPALDEDEWERQDITPFTTDDLHPHAYTFMLLERAN